jgi:acetylornithine/succinyldiaminopimelate/putrescine aminotransferase
MERLKELVGGPITGLVGKGMIIGIRLKDATMARKAIDLTFERGLHIVIGNENNLQLMPPLTIPQDLLDEGLEILISALNRI